MHAPLIRHFRYFDLMLRFMITYAAAKHNSSACLRVTRASAVLIRFIDVTRRLLPRQLIRRLLLLLLSIDILIGLLLPAATSCHDAFLRYVFFERFTIAHARRVIP